MTKPGRSQRRAGYLTMTHVAVVLLLLILFVSVGYYFMLVDPAGSAAQSERMVEFQEHRQRWLERHPQALRYIVDRDCECAAELAEAYTATEVGDEKIAAFPPHVRDRFAEPNAVPESPLWIDDLFDIVAAAIRADELVSVNYDFALGFPTFIDRRSRNAGAARAERFEVRDFETIRVDD